MTVVAVAQLGSRMHYAVPRILHTAGLLGRFYTDLCAVRGWPRLCRLVPRSLQPVPLRRVADRVPLDIPSSRITAFTSFGFEYARRRARAATPAAMSEAYLWGGRTFAGLVVRHGLHGMDGVYGFNTAALELLQAAHERRMLAVLEQTIAPQEVMISLLAEERAAHPHWEAVPADDSEAVLCEREQAERNRADLIVCGSDFVRDGLVAHGCPAHRCVVVPYGVDADDELPRQSRHEGPLRVLTIGEVGLRKGSPYVLEAARRLKGRAVFRMVGNVRVPPGAHAELRAAVELTGPLTSPDVREQYAWADVFLLPSIVEGSATVVYEALVCSLPVICTANTGSVVRDGVEGFVVPLRDGRAIAERLERLMDPVVRAEMGRQARARAGEFDVKSYGRRLVAALGKGEIRT